MISFQITFCVKKITRSFYTLAHPGSIDWGLLIFLGLFLNVKLLVKIAAVVFIYLLRPDFKFGFRFKSSRLPLFYPFVIGIAIFTWLISGKVGHFNYGLVLITGILFWLLCILAIHQVKIAIDKNSIESLHRTILIFFIINAIISFSVYAGIIWETGAVNPYRYQGNFQKYFIGTGDYIKGISFDTSTTNAVLNALGVIYFLGHKKNAMALLCMAVLLFTGSNISSLFLCAVLIFMFIFQSSRDQKSIIVICLLMLVTFLVKVSPENNKYFVSVYQQLFDIKKSAKGVPGNEIPITQRPDSSLTTEERKQKFAQLFLDSINRAIFERKQKNISVTSVEKKPGTEYQDKPAMPVENIHTPPFQHKEDTNTSKKQLLSFVQKNSKAMPIASGFVPKLALPGKIISFRQTLYYLADHPGKLVTGAGMGNFSSKLAFRATAMKIAGGYPGKVAYINDDFKTNHLDLYLYYFTGRAELHSVTNSPNSTYDQLLSEYGLAGLFSFAFFYISFFWKKLISRSYGVPVLLFMLSAFAIDYWFEQLSVVVFAELLLLVNIKESNSVQNDA